MTVFSPGAPDSVLIIEDYLAADTIAALRNYADGQIGRTSKIEEPLHDGKLQVKRTDGFSSDYISIKDIEDTVLGIFNHIFGDVIRDRYGAKIEWYEHPHILRYRKGGNYKPHSDADNWDANKLDWVRSVDRDFSAILYFNDEFEGGGLYFPIHDYRIMPKSGMLVCFPSDGLFAHTAEPVTRGNRYAIVSWAAACGSGRVFDKPRGEIIYMQDTR